jgi:hypothetical protein
VGRPCGLNVGARGSRADLIFQLVNPARTDHEVEHKFKPTPEEWVDRADLMSVLGDPAPTHHEVKHKSKATPEEWVDRTD